MLRIITYKNVLQTIEFDKKVLKIRDGLGMVQYKNGII
jgi:hypothetical protein